LKTAWWRETWLIARREIDERSRARSFRITTAIMILAVAAAVVIPALVSHHHKIEKVGLLGASDSALTQAAIAAGRVTGNRVQVVPVASLDAARAELRSGALAAVIVDGREVLIKQQPVSGTTSSTATFSGALAQLVGVAQRLPPGAARSALTKGIAIPIRGVEPAPRSLASRFTGLGVDLLIYLVIFFYGMAITQSVGEEKTSRVVEVMLATVRPTQLLTGKVIGFAGLAFAQLLLAGVTFVVCGVAVGSHALRGTAGTVALVGALWLIIGYALYCSAFAAAGATITRQADAANAAFPLLIPLIVAYSLSTGVLFNGAYSFYHVLAFIPWTAPVAMPTLFAIGAAPVWQMIVSALLCVIATIATARLAGLVYQRSVMRTGARVKLRQVLRAGPG
jgi:ABC-2 type transport system permease protein